LNATGVSATTAGTGLEKLVGKVAMLTGAMKGIDISDSYMNTSARLGLITDDLKEQKALQKDIFAAANRSKGSYAGMANAVAKLGITAMDAFGSNSELVGFTELLQKSFKVGGASQSEQSSGLLQLTQAMAAGKLQGDEFRSIMENAPMVAMAIAEYTGKSKGELKEMSADGLITADIIKNAMFMAADDINSKFADMPYTFADIWTKVKNGGLKAFDPVINKINKLINTDGFMSFVDRVIGGFNTAANAVSWFIDAIVAGWPVIQPILFAISSVMLVDMIRKIYIAAAGWWSMHLPILLIIGVIASVIIILNHLGISFQDIFSFVGGVVGVFATYFYNRFVYMWNFVAAFINFFGNVFNDPVASIKALFLDLAVTGLGYIEKLAQGIEDVLNKIPGVNIDLTSGIESFKNKLADASASIKSEAQLKTYVQSKDFMDYSEGYTKGSNMGSDIYSKMSGAITGLTDSITGTSSDPTIVEGSGANGGVKVDMSDEDLSYLRSLAERDYINKFSSATLAPNIVFNISDVKETADLNVLKGYLEGIMREEIDLVAEGD
jgi:tape measure domain-containing protein